MSEQKTTSRRDFVMGAATGIGAGAIGAMGLYSYTPAAYKHFVSLPRGNREEFGAVRSVKITNISETSWFDNATLMGDIQAAGGLLVNQYTIGWPPFGNGKGIARGSFESGLESIRKMIPGNLEEAWALQSKLGLHPENPGGFSCLIEVESLDGTLHKYLLDSGWSFDWMDKAFKREKIDQMLAAHEIEALFLSHEHWDHFWGLPVTVKYDDRIPIYTHNGFYKEGLQYIAATGHKGKLFVQDKPIERIIPGMVVVKYDVPIINRVFGETSLAFNIKDKGLLSISGCNHQGILQCTSFLRNNLKYDNDKFYGIYGGLHISPFEDWDPKYDDLVISLKQYEFDKIGCNHCTGVITAHKFVERGYPVVKGTARFRSKTADYLGNGDTIVF
ncbi:twin-arginine translocation signal domain-containing protein [Rhodoplanes roseus]|uniref:MBL fold metallo-hydrolase n=1 Tax=Rhodoplanes roseus TaxID=29409 RepID=A0A327L474_9BRAD|nr:twin-arginine translocation signal domain-containing protein [Rhodoplanes roseus]RAI44974.1 MBL fold metallo-hydrolase [Rhodoplanes roseus]